MSVSDTEAEDAAEKPRKLTIMANHCLDIQLLMPGPARSAVHTWSREQPAWPKTAPARRPSIYFEEESHDFVERHLVEEAASIAKDDHLGEQLHVGAASREEIRRDQLLPHPVQLRDQLPPLRSDKGSGVLRVSKQCLRTRHGGCAGQCMPVLQAACVHVFLPGSNTLRT